MITNYTLSASNEAALIDKIKRIRMATSQISLLDSYTQVERDEFEQRDLL